MIKFSSITDFDSGVEPVRIVKDNSTLVKCGGAKDRLNFEKTKNQTDVHVIALGSDEGYGKNRNADGFTEKDCIERHHTFVQAGRALNKNHKNKPEDPKYGNIKASAYNPNMRRIELVLGIDNDKGADILSEIEKTGSAPFSMGCRVPYDVCTACGRKAKNESERCKHIPRQLGEITKTGVEIGMMNPSPIWFELSHVRRPADRIGYSLKYASENVKLSTSDYLSFYPGFVPPIEEILISKHAADKRALLHKLSEMEKHIDAIGRKHKHETAKDLYLARHASKINYGDDISDSCMDELRKFDPQQLLKALADKGIIFSPHDFSKYLFGSKIKKENVEGMKTHLPDVFSKLKDDPATLNDSKFDPFEGSMLPKEIKNLVSGLFDDHSLSGEPAHARVIRITIIGKPESKLSKDVEKTSSDFDAELAHVYASYKLAALNYIHDNGHLDDELIWNALIQNRK